MPVGTQKIRRSRTLTTLTSLNHTATADHPFVAIAILEARHARIWARSAWHRAGS
jgi:hypothetical protein